MRLNLLCALLVLFVIPCLAASSNSLRRQSTLSQGDNQTPFVLIEDTPWIKVATGGREWLFVLHTGSSYCAVSSEFAKENFLAPSRDRIAIRNATGAVSSNSLVKLPPFWIGSKFFAGEPAVVSSDGILGKTSGGESIHGVIGFGLLSRYTVTFDYHANLLQLASTNLHTGSLSNSASVIPYYVSNGVPYISVSIQGKALPFLVDTGYGGSLACPATDLGLNYISESRSSNQMLSIRLPVRSRYMRLSGTVQIGGLAIENPIVKEGPRSLIGGEVLKRFRVTIHPMLGAMVFERTGPEVFRPPTIRGIGVRFSRASVPWRVLDTVRDDVGNLGNIREGDLCSAIEGRPVSELLPEELQELFARTNMLSLELVRGSTNFTARTPVIVFIE